MWCGYNLCTYGSSSKTSYRYPMSLSCDPDDIRDNMSEMNQTPGAPDPTFGGLSVPKTQWELTMETLESDLLKDIESLARYRYSLYDRRHSG